MATETAPETAPEGFLHLPVRSWRDLLRVRQRARQVAQLLRFGQQEVIAIAAGAFFVAHQVRLLRCRASVRFALVERQLRIELCSVGRPLPAGLTVLSKRLPEAEGAVADTDIPWLLAQVDQLSPAPVEDEIRRQNEELLLMLALVPERISAETPRVAAPVYPARPA